MKEKMIPLLVSEQEKLAIKEAATKKHLPVNNYIRMVVFEHINKN